MSRSRKRRRRRPGVPENNPPKPGIVADGCAYKLTNTPHTFKLGAIFKAAQEAKRKAT